MISFLDIFVCCQIDSDEGREREIQDRDERPSAAALWDARRAGPSQEGRSYKYRERSPSEGKWNHMTKDALHKSTVSSFKAPAVDLRWWRCAWLVGCLSGYGAAACGVSGDATGKGGAGGGAAPQGEGAQCSEGGAKRWGVETKTSVREMDI